MVDGYLNIFEIFLYTNLLYNFRFQLEDERLQKLLFMIHECFRVIDMTGGVLNLLPCVRHFAPDLSGYRPLVNAHKPLWVFLKVNYIHKLFVQRQIILDSFFCSHLKGHCQ